MISTEVFMDIIAMQHSGLSVRQIARKLGIHRNTVKKHMRRKSFLITISCVFPASLRSGKKFAGGEAGGANVPPSLPIVVLQAASGLKFWVERANQESLTGKLAW